MGDMPAPFHGLSSVVDAWRKTKAQWDIEKLSLFQYISPELEDVLEQADAYMRTVESQETENQCESSFSPERG